MPRTLPLTVLLSSLVAFNGLNRDSRLATVGTTNVSLVRTFHSLVIVAIVVVFKSFCFRGGMNPRSGRGLTRLLVSVGRGDPRLRVPRNVFCSKVPGYGLCIRGGSLGAKGLCNVVVCHVASDCRSTTVVLTSSKVLRDATRGGRLILDLCDKR